MKAHKKSSHRRSKHGVIRACASAPSKSPTSPRRVRQPKRKGGGEVVPQRKVDPSDRVRLERLLRDVQDGTRTLNATEIAERTGFSVSTVTAAAGKLGIEFPKTGRRRVIDHQRVLELLEQGEPEEVIAAHVGSTPQAIYNIQRRNNKK